MAGVFCHGKADYGFLDSWIDSFLKNQEFEAFSPKVVLVGSNFLGIHLRRKIALRKSGVCGLRCLTFVDLAKALTEEVYLQRRVCPFPKDWERLFLGGALASLPNDHFFSRWKDKSGFVDALLSSFHDLLDANLRDVKPLNAKLEALSEIFSTHQASYQNHFRTTAELILDAAHEASRYTSVFSVQKLYVYGFYDLTEAQRVLLEKLSNEIELDVALPIPDPEAETARRTLSFFRGLGLRETTLSLNSPSPQVFISSSSNPYREAEDLVRALLVLLKDEPDLSLNEVGVLLRDRETYERPVAEALSRAKIPFYREGGTPIRELPLGRAFLFFLQNLGGPWKRGVLVDLFLQLPFRSDLISNTGQPADWDDWTKKSLCVSGLSSILSSLKRMSEEAISQNEREPFLGFVQFMETFVDLTTRIEKSQSWKAFSDSLKVWLKSFLDVNEVSDRILDGLSEIDRADTFFPFHLKTAVDHLSRGISSLSIQDARFERDGVFLGSLSSVRGVPFSYLFLPAMADKIFPGTSKPDPLLLDEERAKHDGSHLRLSHKGHRLEEERVLFASILSYVKKKVFLSYPRADARSGRELLPSIFLSEHPLCSTTSIHHHEYFQQRSVSDHETLDPADWVSRSLSSKILSYPLKERHLLLLNHPLAQSVSSWVENRFGSSRLTPYDGLLRNDAFRDAQSLFISSSELSTFAICPYRFFLRYQLKLKSAFAADELEEIRPQDKGTLVHHFLQAFYARAKALKLLPLQEQDASRIISLFDDVAKNELDEPSIHVPLGHPALWKEERQHILSELKRMILLEAREASDYIPEAFEVRFGMRATKDHEISPFENAQVWVDLPDGRLRFRGVIDRMDVSKDRSRVRVIDYKTGRPSNVSKSSFQSGKAVQIPIYLLAAQAFFPEMSAKGMDGFLFYTSARTGFRRIPFYGRDLLERQTDFQTIGKTFLNAYRAGSFPPVPGKGLNNCNSCDYRRICGPGIGSVFAHKKSDTIYEEILSLEDIQ